MQRKRVSPSARALLIAAVLASGAAHAADRLPQTPTDLAKGRGEMTPAVDAFAAKSTKASRPAHELPLPPPPPQLPYTYGGSGLLDGKPVLFLERESRALAVRVGDLIDGVYRLESLGPNGALLRYLPLDASQMMAFTAGALAELAPAPKSAQGSLILELPDQALLGQEVPLSLRIPPGSPAAKATVELTYDADTLSVLGAKVIRPGRAVIELAARDAMRGSQLRLKAIGGESVQTELGIAVLAFDAHGKSVAVEVPPQHVITLVEAAN